MGSAESLLQVRRWAALALLVAGAVLTLRPMLSELMDPAWPQPDEYQTQLDAWARVLAPIDSKVPAGEALVFACATDEQGKPLPDLDREFDLVQAVLAPRRIGRAVDGRNVLVLYRAAEGQELPSVAGARVVAELGKGVILLEREGP